MYLYLQTGRSVDCHHSMIMYGGKINSKLLQYRVNQYRILMHAYTYTLNK